MRIEQTMLMVTKLNMVVGARFRINNNGAKYCIDTSSDSVISMFRDIAKKKKWELYYNGVEHGSLDDEGNYKTNLEPPDAIEIENNVQLSAFLKKFS